MPAWTTSTSTGRTSAAEGTNPARGNLFVRERPDAAGSALYRAPRTSPIVNTQSGILP